MTDTSGPPPGPSSRAFTVRFDGIAITDAQAAAIKESVEAAVAETLRRLHLGDLQGSDINTTMVPESVTNYATDGLVYQPRPR